MKRAENSRAGKSRWRCKCECGGSTTTVGSLLLNGGSTSCGCKKKWTGDKCGAYKHGMAASQTHNTWSGMKARCTNKRLDGYKNYGGRGISVCARWSKFENFLADMGECPPGKSLDRINNNGNYEPKNCRWATRLEQSQNSRVPTMLTFNGETKNLTGWATHLGIGVSTLLERLGKWPIGDALSCGKSHRFHRRKI